MIVLLKRELHAVVHGQSAKFRIVKYLILVPTLFTFFIWRGWGAIGWFLFVSFCVAIFVHFFYRVKTGGWEKSWGGFKVK